MKSSDLVSSFAEIAHSKDIDRETLQLIIQDVFRAMIRKHYGADDPEAFDIIFNPDNGDIQLLHVRTVVGNYDVEDPVTQITLKDAVAIDEDFEIEDEVAKELSLSDFGRRAVMTARQTFAQRIRDIEKEHMFEDYIDQVGEIVVGEVYQTRKGEMLVIHNKTELTMPRDEQIRRDRFRKGEMIRAVVKEVKRDAGGTPQVIISRADPLYMERLFEMEVPEIYDGIIEIKKIVREPGNRAKMFVHSTDDRVDPVGACVGMKGVRIHAVARELSNEGIDVIPWASDTVEQIKRALAPAKPIRVTLQPGIGVDEDGNPRPPRAKVIVHPEEVSQAIGKGGINIRLASRLTEHEIDVYREIHSGEDDVDIEEFSDAFPDEVIARLKAIGCDSALSLLDLSTEELARRSGMTEEVAAKVRAVVEAEMNAGAA